MKVKLNVEEITTVIAGENRGEVEGSPKEPFWNEGNNLYLDERSGYTGIHQSSKLKISQAWWRMPVVPAEAGGWLEHKGSRLQ